MSARSKKQNAQRNFGNASSEGAEKWTPKAKDVAGDSQPTPAYGFPAVSADDVKANQAAQQKANATNTANATQWNNGSNYDFLWEATDTKHSAKGQAGTTTVVESDTDYLLLPHPDVFNAYPPEVQRKIMEWADRDVRARRDDEVAAPGCAHTRTGCARAYDHGCPCCDHRSLYRLCDHHGHVHEERSVCGGVPRSGDRCYHGALFHQEERPLRPE